MPQNDLVLSYSAAFAMSALKIILFFFRFSFTFGLVAILREMDAINGDGGAAGSAFARLKLDGVIVG